MGQSAHLGDDVPRSIGGYELLAPIGEGGMGRVFLGRRSVVGGVHRNYAIKLLHANLRAQRDVADQLLEEAKLAAHVAHPNVVQVLQGGEEDGHVFVVMEYVEAVTLASLVRHALGQKRPIPLGIVARIVSDALAGLHAAHQARGEDGLSLGLVHRDFSPQNILVGADGIARLTDFGIAKAISRLGATATGIVKGKVAYLSPEQAMGKSLDQRSDVWAAGVVLWESLARRRLFDESTDTATLLRVVSGPRVPPPSSEWPEVPTAVDEVVLAALERDREARIHDAEELRQRLVQAVGLEHRVAHHVEVADYVSGLIADWRQQIDGLVERALGAEEPTGPTSAVRPLPPRPPLRTLPLDLEDEEAYAEEGDDEPATAPEAPTSLRESEAAAVPEGAPASTPSLDSWPPASLPPASLPPRSVAPGSPTSPSVGGPSRMRPQESSRSGLLLTLGAVAVMGLFAAAVGTMVAGAKLAEPLAASFPIPSITPPAIVETREVRIVADEAIAQLSLGQTHRLLPEPREDISIPLSTPIDEDGLEVVAVTADGRKARGRIETGESTVELSFPKVSPEPAASSEPEAEATAKPVARPIVPRPARPQSPKPNKSKAPGLGPSPY